MSHVPERQCVACRERRPQRDLLRFHAAAGALALGATGGRGVYTCRTLACVERAFERRLLLRRLPAATTAPAGLHEAALAAVSGAPGAAPEQG